MKCSRSPTTGRSPRAMRPNGEEAVGSANISATGAGRDEHGTLRLLIWDTSVVTLDRGDRAARCWSQFASDAVSSAVMAASCVMEHLHRRVGSDDQVWAEDRRRREVAHVADVYGLKNRAVERVQRVEISGVDSRYPDGAATKDG